MISFRKASILGVLSVTAIVAGHAAADAGCTPNVTSTGTTTCIGTGALASNDQNYNTAVGFESLNGAGNGYMNTAMGTRSLYFNTDGASNTAIGYAASLKNTTGQANVALGQSALESNSEGNDNTAVGTLSLSYSTTGSFNTAVGSQAGKNWTTGSNNIAVGANAGSKQTAGSDNISIGAPGSSSDTGIIRIGKKDVHQSVFIAGIRGRPVSSALPVLVKSNGQLGVASSAARYEQDIQPMGSASSALMQLRPVTFRHKQAENDGSRPLQYGLIADEVAKVIPDLAVYDEDGAPEAVAYQILPSLLLNELQKQAVRLDAAEKKLEDTEARLAALEHEMAAMKLSRSQLVASTSQATGFVSLGQ